MRLFLAGFLTTLLSLPSLSPSSALAADAELRKAAEALVAGRMDSSSGLAGDALKSEPKSRLAHWLQAQSMIALAGRPVQLNGADRDLLDEARVRLELTPEGMLPKNLVVMPRSADKNVPILLADASRSRLYVFVSKQGRPVLKEEFYTTIGLWGADKFREGDQKTPLGVYRIQFEIRDPRKDGFLGKYAMTLDYPNAFDNHSGRTGSGIWIHGVPDSLHVRAPQASDGCLAIANRDLNRLRKLVRYNESQIVVVPRIEWVTPEVWAANAAQAVKDFSGSVGQSRLGGIFWIQDNWPWVISHLRGNEVTRREYFQRSPGGLRRLIEEKLS